MDGWQRAYLQSNCLNFGGIIECDGKEICRVGKPWRVYFIFPHSIAVNGMKGGERLEREISVGWHEIRAKKNSHDVPLLLQKSTTHITMYIKISEELVRLLILLTINVTE